MEDMKQRPAAKPKSSLPVKTPANRVLRQIESQRKANPKSQGTPAMQPVKIFPPQATPKPQTHPKGEASRLWNLMESEMHGAVPPPGGPNAPYSLVVFMGELHNPPFKAAPVIGAT